MAFERLSISVANPSKFVGSSRAPVTPGLPTLASRPASKPLPRPPATGGPLPPLRPPGNTPVTGGDLPPLTVNGQPDKAPASPSPAKRDFSAFRKELEKHVKNGAGFMSIMDWLTYGKIPGNGGWGKPAILGVTGQGGNGNKPGGSKPPATPTPQWAFKPNPLDQPSYVTPMGNAAAYTINPPAQQWMFDPATYGQGAPPQWYGQPVVPNSQPPFRY